MLKLNTNMKINNFNNIYKKNTQNSQTHSHRQALGSNADLTTSKPLQAFNFGYAYPPIKISFGASKETGKTGWVTVPSKLNDKKNYEQNVEKLKELSLKNEKTKLFNPEQALLTDDFQIYIENGQPKIVMRMLDDIVKDIQSEDNAKIPAAYLDEVKNHIKETKLMPAWEAETEINSAERIKDEIENAKNDLKTAIENKDAKAIFDYFNMAYEENFNGLLNLYYYEQPSNEYTFSELGIDENMLLEKVNKINNDAHFNKSTLKTLKNIKAIGANAYFGNSQITNLGSLEEIGKNAYFNHSQVSDLANLKSIGGNADFQDSKIHSLKNLKTIGGNAEFKDSTVIDLGNLETIGGNANFSDSEITNLGNLKSIAGNADFRNSKVTDLGDLNSITGQVYFEGSNLKDADFIDIKEN